MKGPMDGIGGTVKNVVFKEVKSGRLSIETPKEFAEAADRLCKVDCLYLPIDLYLDEPEGIDDAPEIKGILKIHQIIRKFERGVAYLNFFKLSGSDEQFYRQFYKTDPDQQVCGHIVTVKVDDFTCGKCLEAYVEGDGKEWLQCTLCHIWFHEDPCFYID